MTVRWKWKAGKEEKVLKPKWSGSYQQWDCSENWWEWTGSQSRRTQDQRTRRKCEVSETLQDYNMLIGSVKKKCFEIMLFSLSLSFNSHCRSSMLSASAVATVSFYFIQLFFPIQKNQQSIIMLPKYKQIRFLGKSEERCVILLKMTWCIYSHMFSKGFLSVLIKTLPNLWTYRAACQPYGKYLPSNIEQLN